MEMNYQFGGLDDAAGEGERVEEAQLALGGLAIAVAITASC